MMGVIAVSKKQPLTGVVDAPVLVLGLLTLIGLVVGIWRLMVGMGPTTNLTDAYPWGLWIGFDFALIAFSGAGFTMAGLVYIFRLEKFRPALKPALLAGLLGYVAVLLLLVLDLGRWDRFYMFIISWNIHSPLFEVSWCVLLYTTVLFFENSPPFFEQLRLQSLSRFVHKYIIPFVVAAVTLSTLHQSTLGTLYLNMPHRLGALWFTPILPLLFFTSSIMAGLSVAIIAYLIAGNIRKEAAKPEVISGLATIVAWTTLVYVALKLADLALAGELGALLAFDRPSGLMWLELGAGAILPLVLLFTPALRQNRSVIWAGTLLILLGVLANRFNATLFAQAAPEWTTYAPHLAEWLSTIGVLAGAGLAWYLAVRYFIYNDKKQA
jgi:Ni/Fe-hydrogenase subunit HybB-like protein